MLVEIYEVQYYNVCQTFIKTSIKPRLEKREFGPFILHRQSHHMCTHCLCHVARATFTFTNSC